LNLGAGGRSGAPILPKHARKYVPVGLDCGHPWPQTVSEGWGRPTAQISELFSFKDGFTPFQKRLNPFLYILTGHDRLQVREQPLFGHLLTFTDRNF